MGKKFGGWLYLVGFSICANFLLCLYYLVAGMAELRLSRTFDLILAFESLYSMLTCVLHGMIIYLFFKKDHRFPHFSSWLLIFSAISSVMSEIAFYSDYGLENTTLRDVIKHILSIFLLTIGCRIWILYMRRSQRVKETFVNHYNSLKWFNPKLFVIPLFVQILLSIYYSALAQ